MDIEIDSEIDLELGLPHPIYINNNEISYNRIYIENFLLFIKKYKNYYNDFWWNNN